MRPTDVFSEELLIEDLDHLGIVAAVVDQIGLIECIDARLGTYEDEHLSAGQVVKAMVLNGLGFVSAPLYLFSRFSRASPPSTCREKASNRSTSTTTSSGGSWRSSTKADSPHCSWRSPRRPWVPSG